MAAVLRVAERRRADNPFIHDLFHDFIFVCGKLADLVDNLNGSVDNAPSGTYHEDEKNKQGAYRYAVDEGLPVWNL